MMKSMLVLRSWASSTMTVPMGLSRPSRSQLIIVPSVT